VSRSSSEYLTIRFSIAKPAMPVNYLEGNQFRLS
jgi:hypothetical protein